jgi:rsbT co-antagonist protein RsbR
VEIVDTGTAQHFLRTVKAAELLGVQSILTGIRPPVAKTLVALGSDLSEVRTCATLQQGLELAMRLIADEAGPGDANNGAPARSSRESGTRRRR